MSSAALEDIMVDAGDRVAVDSAGNDTPEEGNVVDDGVGEWRW